eukprot:SAG22_NODE_4577_length_1227_cov_1.463652_2_plen_207_part_01
MPHWQWQWQWRCCTPSGEEAPPAVLLASATPPQAASPPAAPPPPAPREAGRVLLFYRYCKVPSPAGLVAAQTALCTQLGLTGRIRIASEGINGTVGGTVAACEAYEAAAAALPFLDGMQFKRSAPASGSGSGSGCGSGSGGAGGASEFSSLLVKECQEIVTLGIPPAELSHAGAGRHLSPREFRAAVLAASGRPCGGDDDQSVVILD